MPSPRRDARRHYRHFPPEYTQLLLAFNERGSASVGPLSHRDAKAALRDLYRFKMLLSAGVDEDPDDDHARGLLSIASSAIMRVEPCAVASGDHDTHLVSLSLNPIVASVRRDAE